MNRITGIWDLARSSGSLGTLLVLLEELEIQRHIHRAEEAEVVFVADASQLLHGIAWEPQVAQRVPAVSSIANLHAMTAVARAMSAVARCHACVDREAIGGAIRAIRSGRAVWPDLETLVRGGHDYDSTSVIRQFHAQTGGIPPLSVNAALLARAHRYLEANAHGRMAVAVHLKNQVSGQSNADPAAWLAFMADCRRVRPAHFFLIGDDAIDPAFRTLPNVTIAQDEGMAIDGYLALIQAARLFMGMMSGPANMALFGRNPYVLFKHPDHHAREMAMELGDADHYPFALPGQRVLRTRDTTENLMQAFESAAQEVCA